jgi:hypothetical protein
MRWRILTYSLFFSFFSLQDLVAQRVLYSPFMEDRSSFHVEPAGHSAGFYWFLRQKLGQAYLHHTETRASPEQEDFAIYDSHMRLSGRTPTQAVPAARIKEYLIGGESYFDQLTISSSSSGERAELVRYPPDGSSAPQIRLLADFPFYEGPNSFLVIRSGDKGRILLLVFESVPESAPRIHALLFDRNWNRLQYRIYKHPFLTQPFLQDDFADYPAECFGHEPVKLFDTGEWLMLAPSRTNHNFLLFDFPLGDSAFVHKEINLPSSSTMEDLALSLDNLQGQATAGILSIFRYPVLKSAQIVRYDLATRNFVFDSSYRFSTLAGTRVKNEKLVHESFVPLSSSGFLLMKEYGRDLTDPPQVEAFDEPWDIEALFVSSAINNPWMPPQINRDGYTRYNRLGGLRNLYSRGDLNLFFLPAQARDSAWSGIINKEQLTEMNAPDLSYLVAPEGDQVYFLYNSGTGNDQQYGSTTLLDARGNLMDAGSLVFWKFSNTLDFQQSRQIAEKEFAIPYANARRSGFAIIRFD